MRGNEQCAAQAAARYAVPLSLNRNQVKPLSRLDPNVSERFVAVYGVSLLKNRVVGRLGRQFIEPTSSRRGDIKIIGKRPGNCDT